MFRRFSALAYAVWFSLLFVCLTASAADLEMSQMHHKAWRAVDGAPTDVQASAQTSDGYLWLGTATGLYRFDGVRFEPVESAYRVTLLSSAIKSLFASSDGGLWIGYLFGGASHLRSGKITHYRPNLVGEPSLDGGSLNSFAEEKDGTMWASSASLNVFRNKKWQRADPALPPSNMSGVFVDSRGGIWAGLSDGLYWRAKASATFTKVGDKSGITYFAEAPDGAVWAVTNPQGYARFDPANGRQLHMVQHLEKAGVSGTPMFDRSGNLWVASNDRFLVRTPKAALVEEISAGKVGYELLTEKNGLSGGLVTSVLQDREGNIWTSTSNGIDRLRESRVVPVEIPAPEGTVVLTMTAAEEGKVWVSDWGSGLYLAGKRGELVDKELRHMIFMYRAPSGRVWMGNRRELWMREKTELKRISWPVDTSRTVPQAALEDPDGGLWVSLAGQGLFRFFEGAWVDKSALFPKGRVINVMAHDAAGGFWAGYGPNLARFRGESIQLYRAAEGLNAGPILAITANRGRVWVAGLDGVMGHDGQRFHPLKGRNAHAFKGVSGIVATSNGDLWLNGSEGFIHIPSAELVKWSADRSYAVTYEVLDYLDGVVGKPKQTRPLPTALEASDGRLWFTTGKNLSVVDPSKIMRNTLPPPVVITQVDIDGTEADRGAPIELKPDALRIEIGFAGLSLTTPERNRYRYRLVGVDRDWLPASGNRSVSYTNLAPGSYRFKVSASNNDGVWATGPAQLRFDVLPAFYQTWWFRCTIALLLGLALWLAYRMRMKVLTQRISDRLQSQQMERMRIARELHDTLLQGVASLSLVMRRAINKIDREHPVVPFLSDGMKQAESVIEEGRIRVARLRVNAAAGDDLVDELGSLGLELTAGSKTRFLLTVTGDIRSLEAQVAEESRIIAREAIWNAVQHANADTISLTVEFSRRHLVLRVQDDGPGLPPEVLAAGAREGHWGLPGMRERACRIGGRLDIIATKGTTIELRVPARLAYKPVKRAGHIAASLP